MPETNHLTLIKAQVWKYKSIENSTPVNIAVLHDRAGSDSFKPDELARFERLFARIAEVL